MACEVPAAFEDERGSKYPEEDRLFVASDDAVAEHRFSENEQS